MTIKKLVAIEYQVTEEDMNPAKWEIGVGDRYSYFYDEETGKFYAPRDGYTVLGDDLGEMFYEVATRGKEDSLSPWIRLSDLTHFNLKEGDVLAVRVNSLESMYPFIEEITKMFEVAIAHLKGKVIVAVMDNNTSLSNDPTGAEMIFAERKRQIEIKGLDADNDDKWADGEMAHAAAHYAEIHPFDGAMIQLESQRMFGDKYKHDRIRQLTIAGALIAAEIDRLKRLADRDGVEE